METINGNIYMFHNEMPYCRDGFTHKSTLLRNGEIIGEARVHYTNRSWENYRYQTSMRMAIENVMASELDALIDHYKRESGIKRISKDKREELAVSTPYLLELKELRDSL
jgi:hypothetical protein